MQVQKALCNRIFVNGKSITKYAGLSISKKSPSFKSKNFPMLCCYYVTQKKSTGTKNKPFFFFFAVYTDFRPCKPESDPGDLVSRSQLLPGARRLWGTPGSQRHYLRLRRQSTIQLQNYNRRSARQGETLQATYACCLVFWGFFCKQDSLPLTLKEISTIVPILTMIDQT